MTDFLVRVYLLFRRVGELVLAASVVALLDAGVGPQGSDCIDVLRLKCRNSLVVYLSNKFAVLLLIQYTKYNNNTLL